MIHIWNDCVGTIYPNPAVDKLRLKFNEINIIRSFNYKIINVTGILVDQGISADNGFISVKKFSPGLYLLTVSLDDKKIVKEFIKQ